MITLLLSLLIGTVNAQSISLGYGGADNFKSSVPLSTALPTSGNSIGDIRVVQVPLAMWGWDGAVWQDLSGGGGGGGITSLNGLVAAAQVFAVGTAGTDFAVSSALSTHTFNLPTASAVNRGALSSADWTTFNNKEPAITAGTVLQYYRGDKTFQTLNTLAVPELTNLYFTEARVRASLLTGFVSGAGVVTAADDVLSAIEKLDGNISALVTGVSSVFGRTGAVVAAASDYDAIQVDNTPAGGIAAVTVQGAIDELDSEKQNLLVNSAGLAAAISDETGTGVAVFSADPALTGNPTAPTQSANDNSTKIATTAYADAAASAAASGTANTFAGFDGTGDLYTIPGFGISTTTGGASVDLTYVPVNAAGQTKIHRFETEIDPQSNTTGDTVNGAFFDLHAGRLTSGFGVGDGFNALYSSFSIDNDGAYGNINNFVSGGNFGDGVGGSATSIQDFNSYDTIDAGFHVDDYRPLVIGTNSAGDVDDEEIIQINNIGDVNNGSTGVHFSKTGDVGFLTGFRMDYNGTSGGGYGMSHVLQGDMTNQFEHINLSNSANVAGNYFLVNSNMSGDITGFGGFFGLNMNMTGDSNNVSPVNAINSGDTGYINAIAFDNSGTVTNGITGLNLTNSGQSQYISALNYGNTGSQTGGYQILNVQDTPTAATSATGLNLNMTGTYSTSVQGINVNVDTATSPSKVSIGASGGLSSISSAISTANGAPPSSFAMNYLGGQFTVASGFPLTGEFGFGNNLATSSLFYDDMPADITTLGLGYTHVGFVGQIIVDAGKTVDSMNMALAGGGVSAGSSGNITNANMYHAAGFLNQGGTVTVTNMKGFYSNSPLCAMATNCWAFFDGSNAENYLSKLAIGTVSNKVGAGLEFDVLGDSRFTGSVDLSGHIISTGTAPTANVDANAGTGATCTVSLATDSKGEVQIVSGSGSWAAGSQCDVTFNAVYSSAPVCTISAKDANTAALITNQYITTTTTEMTINFSTPDVASSTYNFSYQCIQ